MNREEKKQATRNGLMEAAWALFADQGYESTTIQQITERAGVAKGTFFNYFQSKEEVICELQVLWTQEEIGKLLAKDGPLVPRIKLMLTDLTRRFPMTRSLALASVQAMISNEEVLKTQAGEMLEVVKALIPVVELGQKRGEIQPHWNPAQIAENALKYYFGVLLTWGMGIGEDDLSEQMALSFEWFFESVVVH